MRGSQFQTPSIIETVFMDKHWKGHKDNIHKMKSDIKETGADTTRLMDEFRIKHALAQRWKENKELQAKNEGHVRLVERFHAIEEGRFTSVPRGVLGRPVKDQHGRTDRSIDSIQFLSKTRDYETRIKKAEKVAVENLQLQDKIFNSEIEPGLSIQKSRKDFLLHLKMKEKISKARRRVVAQSVDMRERFLQKRQE